MSYDTLALIHSIAAYVWFGALFRSLVFATLSTRRSADGVLVGAFAMLSSARLLEALRDRLVGRRPEAAGVPRLRRLVAHGFEILLQARRCHAPALLVSATMLSAVAWAAEAWAFDLILRWMGIDVPLSFAVFVYAISMLAGALSMMPGGLGGAEGAMVALLMLEGVQGPDAVAATVLIRLATLWFAVAIGAVVRGFQPARPDAPTRN